jgi:secreted protein with Ig-like and vWFA domain
MRSCSLASTITIESSPNRKSPPHFETTSPSIVGEPNTTRQPTIMNAIKTVQSYSGLLLKKL